MKKLALLSFILLALSLQTPKEALARPQAQITGAGQLIDAVNGLRISYGLPPLPSHPILMQSAQAQADYMAATGQITHARPGGGTYTQQLISLGFPLAGDLSLGGMRAENLVSSNGPLVWSGVPAAWQDELHMNGAVGAGADFDPHAARNRVAAISFFDTGYLRRLSSACVPADAPFA